MGSALRVSNPNIWAATIQELDSLYQEFKASRDTAIEKGIEIGEMLTKVKGALKHGEWLPWLSEFAPFSQQMAWYYVTAYEHRDEIRAILLSGGNFTFRQLSNGEVRKPQQLHESNFYFHSIKLTQRLMGDINHELKDHPLETWDRDKWISLAAATEPLAELHQRLKALIA